MDFRFKNGLLEELLKRKIGRRGGVIKKPYVINTEVNFLEELLKKNKSKYARSIVLEV